MRTFDIVVIVLAVLGVAAVWWYTRRKPSEGDELEAPSEPAPETVMRVPGGPERIVVRIAEDRL